MVRKVVWIGGSLSIFAVLALVLTFSGVKVTNSGDISCAEECVSYINITSRYYDFCFNSTFELIKTDPSGIPVDVYFYNATKKKWFLWTGQCFKSSTQLKIVGHKKNFQKVKWYSPSLKVADPVWDSAKISLLDGRCERYAKQELVNTTPYRCVNQTWPNSTKWTNCSYAKYNWTYCSQWNPDQFIQMSGINTSADDMNVHCSLEKSPMKLICDDKFDGNGDGIIQPGESGIIMTNDKTTYYNYRFFFVKEKFKKNKIDDKEDKDVAID
jgi:hypothetical protein